MNTPPIIVLGDMLFSWVQTAMISLQSEEGWRTHDGREKKQKTAIFIPS